MLAADRLFPAVTSAGLLMLTPVVTPGYTATIRLPSRDVEARASAGAIDVRALMIEQGVYVTPALTAHPAADIFTAGDSEILDTVDRARVDDIFDYAALLEYDDD